MAYEIIRWYVNRMYISRRVMLKLQRKRDVKQTEHIRRPVSIVSNESCVRIVNILIIMKLLKQNG